jgi:flagellin-like protein
MARKGVSPVVAVVILVGLAVMIGGLVSSWLTSFVADSARQDTCAITTTYTLTEPTYNPTSGELKVRLKNTGNNELYNFTFEADNGTVIMLIPATYPNESYHVGSGRTQYVTGNVTDFNITGVDEVTVLTASCPSYSPVAVIVRNI